MKTTTNQPADHLYRYTLVMKYAKLSLAVAGVTLNIAVFLVVTHKSMRKLPITVFMAALAISDSTTLVCSTLMEQIPDLEALLRLKTSYVCDPRKLWNLFFSLMTGYSGWLIAVVSSERLIAVKWPLFAKANITRKVEVVVSFAVLGVLVMGAFIAWYDVTGSNCDGVGTRNFTGVFILTYVAPLVVTLGTYLSLLVLMCKRRHLEVAPVTQAARLARQTTLSALAICGAFLLLTLPMRLYSALTRGDIDDVITTVLILVYNLNYSVNFFIYLATSTNFRKSVVKLICRCRKPSQVAPLDNVHMGPVNLA